MSLKRLQRSAAAVAVAGVLAHLVLRILGATTRKRLVGEAELYARFRADERVILAFWHGRMLMMPFAYRGSGACIMNSQHRDGEIISRAIRPFGIEVVRGSSSRGWVGGLKGLLAAHRQGRDLVVVPDGPRGPRCRAKSGVVQLARATGAPIYPVAFAASRSIVLERSWDWLAVPRPFSRVVYVVGEPIRVAREANAEQIEAARLQLETGLNAAVRRADGEVGVALDRTKAYVGAGDGADVAPRVAAAASAGERDAASAGAPESGKESIAMKRTSMVWVVALGMVLASGARGWAEDTGAAPVAGGEAAAAAAASAPAAAPDPTGAAKRFDSFSATWFDKLEAREKHNLDKIQWKKEGEEVVGEYVAYDTTTTSKEVSNNDGKAVPIGKVIYREQKLRLKGTSQTEALAQKPEVVDETEVTEIFQYRKGDWIY